MTIMSDNMYALEGYKRVYKQGKGYVDVSKAYPEGVPRSMGRASGGGVLMARIARNYGGIQSQFSPAEVAYSIQQNDPRNTPLGHAIGVSSFQYPVIIPAEFTTGTSAERAALSAAYEARVTGTTASRSAGAGIAAGGTALARGGPSVGTAPGAGLSLGGVSSGISSVGGTLSNVGSGIMNTITPYIPLATKVILAVVVIKVALALFSRRR